MSSGRASQTRWVAVLALALFLVPVAGAQATITVANNNDAGAGSLRKAIVDAASGETIVVPPNTYTLTTGELLIDKSVTISGAGAGNTIVRAGGAFRVFHTTGAGNTITISGITIRDGHIVSGIAQGGGVSNQAAALTLSDVVVTNNHADSNGAPGMRGGIGQGGGVFHNSGSLTLLRSQVTGNTASANGGAGIPPNGNGGFGSIGQGGGLYDSGGALTVTGTTFAGNVSSATGGQGAGSGNGGSGSISFAGGALIEPRSNPASVSSSTVSGNVADGSGGAPGPTGGTAGAGSFGEAGGLQVTATSASGVIPLTNLTVSGNVARSPVAEGGGLKASGTGTGKVAVTNATLTANTATPPAGTGGNLFPDAGVQLKNTILSAGVASAGKENCSTAPVSLGHNLADRTPSQCGLAAASGDQIGVNPLLGPLQANGGPTQTTALLAGSPAIDAGDNSGCPATDQRGVARPQLAACDIGAYEFVPDQAAVTAPPPPPEVPGGAPVLSGLSLSPSKFRAAPSGPSVAASVGTTVKYSVSKAARVKFGVERAAKGRLVKGKCVKPTKSNATKKRCTRYVTVSGSFTHQGKAGPNKLKFRGRLGRRKLKPGKYRLGAVATDPAGKSSVPKRVRFRIVRR